MKLLRLTYKHLRRYYFFIPFCYSLYSRFKGKDGLKGIVKLPLTWLMVTIWSPDYNLCRFVIAFFYLYSIYEIGYIYNDCETIKIEKNPSLRIPYGDLKYYESTKFYIYFYRFLGVILLFVAAIQLQVELITILSTLMIFPTFYKYNTIRSGLNLYIHLLLAFLKHMTIVAITLNKFEWSIIIWLMLCEPLPFFIELSVKGKFGYHIDIFKKLFIPIYNKYYIHMFYLYYQMAFCLIIIILTYLKAIPRFLIFGNIFYLLFYITTFFLFGLNDKTIRKLKNNKEVQLS